MQEVLSPREIELCNRKGLRENALPVDRADALLPIVMRQRGLSFECALFDLGLELDLIGAGRYESMRRAIGVYEREKSIPDWNAETGELRFKGHVTRHIDGRATNVRLLLDSFEEQHWPARIDSPFPPAGKSRQLRDTVDTLTDDLQLITFYCDGSGKGVAWREVDEHRRNTGT